jgi:hypothetical protein
MTGSLSAKVNASFIIRGRNKKIKPDIIIPTDIIIIRIAAVLGSLRSKKSHRGVRIYAIAALIKSIPKRRVIFSQCRHALHKISSRIIIIRAAHACFLVSLIVSPRSSISNINK